MPQKQLEESYVTNEDFEAPANEQSQFSPAGDTKKLFTLLMIFLPLNGENESLSCLYAELELPNATSCGVIDNFLVRIHGGLCKWLFSLGDYTKFKFISARLWKLQ